MVMLVEPVDGEIALLSARMNSSLHGLFGEDSGGGFMGCGAHGL